MLYSPEHTAWLDRVNPVTKLWLLLMAMIGLLFIHNVNVMFLLTPALVLFVLTGTGHSKRFILLLMLPFLFIFVSTSTSMMFFGKGTTLWWHWGPVRITRESFYRGVHIGLRALCFGLMGLLFALTTRPVLLFYSLMQQLNLPPKYAYGFMASVRLLPLIINEFKTLRRAYKVRGVQVSNNASGVMKKLRLYAIPLLAQSIRRAKRIAVAMEARRFDSKAARTYYYRLSFSRFDVIMIGSWIAIFAGAWLVGNHISIVAITDVRFNG